MRRQRYSSEIMAQASLEVAQDPELGNLSLASRAQEVIMAGEDPFFLVARAINGRVILERAERIRREQSDSGKAGVAR